MGRDCVDSLHTADPKEDPSSVIHNGEVCETISQGQGEPRPAGLYMLKTSTFLFCYWLGCHLGEAPSPDLHYPSHLPSAGGALALIHTELPFSFC